MKVYIAGKITGEEFYQEKFEFFANFERRRGNIVLNPAILPCGMSQADYMRICFAMLDCADKACFIPGYETSPGAMLELDYCKKVGKPWCVYAAVGSRPEVSENG